MNANYKKVYGFGKRLKEEREKVKLSRADVGNMLGGVAISTLQAWEGETREPPISKLMELADILKTTANYLLTGEEEQPKSLIEKAVEKVKDLIEEAVTMIASYSSINVSAGFGSFNEGVTKPDGQEPYFDSLLQSLRVNPENCAVFWANGDSMYPTIDDGDQLLVDLSKNEMKGSDKIYLVQNGESVWVKRVRMEWDYVELLSDNKEYRPITITSEDAQNLQIIGQVVHIGKSLV